MSDIDPNTDFDGALAEAAGKSTSADQPAQTYRPESDSPDAIRAGLAGSEVSTSIRDGLSVPAEPGPVPFSPNSDTIEAAKRIDAEESAASALQEELALRRFGDV